MLSSLAKRTATSTPIEASCLSSLALVSSLLSLLIRSEPGPRRGLPEAFLVSRPGVWRIGVRSLVIGGSRSTPKKAGTHGFFFFVGLPLSSVLSPGHDSVDSHRPKSLGSEHRFSYFDL